MGVTFPYVHIVMFTVEKRKKNILRECGHVLPRFTVMDESKVAGRWAADVAWGVVRGKGGHTSFIA